MLGHDFKSRPLKGADAADPFIDDNPERILVTGLTRLAQQLLRCGVGESASHFLRRERAGMGKSQNEAKITEPDLVVAPQQQVLRLEIAMNELGIVCILQGRSDLLDVVDNGAEGNTCPFWIP